MRFHGGLCDEESLSNLRVGQALADLDAYFALAIGESPKSELGMPTVPDRLIPLEMVK